MPKAIKVILILLILLILVVLGYVAYVFIDYHRIPDMQTVEVVSGRDEEPILTGKTYKAMTWNIGFGAYTPDFSFFMDGGNSSRAASAQSVKDCTDGAGRFAAEQQPDLVLFEEVDLDSDRSWHIDQKHMLDGWFPGFSSIDAVNYDSPYLFYPVTEPHGKSKSSIALYSRFGIASSLRRSLPIATSVLKVLDLDRCYTVSRIPAANGRELVVYTLHLTAYTSDAGVREAQLKMLFDDAKAEAAKGNYVICGGDFNTDLLAEEMLPDAPEWALPFDRNILGDDLMMAWDILSKEEKAALHRSCRDSGVVLTPETQTWMLDGFIVSKNITVSEIGCLDTGFAWSDHDPVIMSFTLND